VNKVLKVYRYQLKESLSAVAIFYLAVLIVAVFLSMLDGGSSSGFEFASAIFIFVLGLNSFKSSFRFLQFLGVTRKCFFAGSLLALLTVAAGMTVVDLILGRLFAQLHPYTTLFAQSYERGSLLLQLAWEFALLGMFALIGFFITILYYRCNKILKIVISLSPVYISLILNLMRPSLAQVTRILEFLGGFRLGVGAWNNILGMLVTVLISCGLSYLLIRKAPVKQ
jgi:hypothetical protein